MIKVGTATKNALKNGEIVLSAREIVDTLNLVKLPVEISEKLYKIGVYSVVRDWREEAAHFLTALSDPSRTYLALLRKHAANIQEIIEARYTATLLKKTDAKANRYKDSRFVETTADEARTVVSHLIVFEVKR